MYQPIGNSLMDSINTGFVTAGMFIPRFILGLVILLIGLILGTIVKRILKETFNILKIDTYLRKYGIPEAKKDFTWTNMLAEIARWFIIVLFLIPTAETWGLPQIVTLLNTFLLYLPNVFVGAIILVVGLVFARLAYDVILASSQEVSSDVAPVIASVARWAIIVFVVLVVLNQLGVAQDLIRILFTGIVAMLALAGGIAFGLGGQETAKVILEAIRKSLTNNSKR